MADALTAREAYLAGAHDVKVATEQVSRALIHGVITEGDVEEFMRDSLLHLWHGRIERGELISDFPLPQEVR